MTQAMFVVFGVSPPLAGSAPQEGLMGLIRGRVPLNTAELRHTAIFRSEYTKIGHDADAADLGT